MRTQFDGWQPEDDADVASPPITQEDGSTASAASSMPEERFTTAVPWSSPPLPPSEAPTSEAPPADPVLPAAGTVLFGRYRLDDLLGRGGMGSVWRVTHLELEAERALKLIAPQISSDPQVRARFQREARVMARLSHPHAVTVHDAQIVAEAAYIEMESIRGQSLDRLLPPRQPISPTWVGRILPQICDVLEEAHAQGIVHRDLKPSNLMLLDGRAEGREYIKVLDFGIAKICQGDGPILGGEGDDAALTRTGSFLGTTAYASPEQIKGETIDGRSDLYSLGVILYELLTGYRPFSGTNELVMASHLMYSPPRFSDRNPACQVPEEIERVVFWLLAKKPEERPESAHVVSVAFADAVNQATVPDDHEFPQIPSRLNGFTPGPNPSWAPTEAAPNPTGEWPTGDVPASPHSVETRPAGTVTAAPPTATWVAPVPETVSTSSRRGWIVAALALLATGGIAAAAWIFRDSSRPPPPPPPKPPSPTIAASLSAWSEQGYQADGGSRPDGWPTRLKRGDTTWEPLDDQGHYLPEGYAAEGPELLEDWPLWVKRRSDGVLFRRVMAGDLEMGSLREDDAEARPVHPVRLSGFYIQKSEVSNGEFGKFLRDHALNCETWRDQDDQLRRNGCPSADDHPAWGVPWFDADAFAHAHGGRLPSEAQWEYVARCGDQTDEHVWSRRPEARAKPNRKCANLMGSSPNLDVPTVPVADLNLVRDDHTDWGILHLTGNVREWCRDVWRSYEPSSVRLSDPEFPQKPDAKGVEMVVRGGSFATSGSDGKTTARSKSIARDATSADDLKGVGFRIVLECPEPSPGVDH